jgi:hypothetical protein
MNTLVNLRTCLVVCGLVVVLQPLQGAAQQNSEASKTSLQQPAAERTGNMISIP